MHTTATDIRTTLSVEELDGVFKTGTKALHGLGGKFASIARSLTPAQSAKFGYFQPRSTGHAEPGDPPSFVLGAVIPTFDGGNGQSVVIQMYVWDRGQYRDVQLITPHGLVSGAMKSKRRLAKLIQTFQAADPAMTLAEA